MSRYYKVEDLDGNLVQIGIDDNTGTEITEAEYTELHQLIQENVVHETCEEKAGEIENEENE